MRRPRLEVADIFHRHGADWRRANAGHVSIGQLQVMAAIEQCRSAALGGHVERCEDCGHSRIAYNSCRNRHCPKCQGAAAQDWLAAREADLLPVGYFHLVFTLPAEIASIAYQNKAVVYDLLFRTAAETLLTIAADPKHLGARIGATAVLHSWGSAMTHHPHIHMIVPGGGISLDGTRWVRCKTGFLLPVRVLSRLFRRLFLAALADAHAAGRLAFFGEIEDLRRRQAFDAHVAPLKRKNCRVGEDVATLTPHRPGRADFPHPVLHERGSLTAAYPWRILTEGSGWRARSALKRAHETTLPRCRRDNHLRQTRTT